MQLALAAQMRELDRQTIEEIGLPGMVLMENAGRGTVAKMEEVLGPVADKSVVIFAGPGNNGGDGLVIARTVHGLGGFPFVFFLQDPERLGGDAGHNFALLNHLRLPYQVLDQAEKRQMLLDTVLTLQRMHPIHSLVDALFGIGLDRPVDGAFLEMINTVNILRQRHRCPVVAVDIPSGLCSNTGAMLGTAIEADLTVTYGLAKPGHLHHGGPQVGRLMPIDIGIPVKLVQRMGLRGVALTSATMAPRLRPRARTAHKGSNGHLLVLAGSTGKTGAALLCGRGALHGGAGLVTFAVPEDCNPIFETALAEAMSVPLPGSQGLLSHTDVAAIRALAVGKAALVLGPGIGIAETTKQLVLSLYAELQLPMVVDADALTLLAAHPDILRHPAGPRVFTPHPGEMARLLAAPLDTIQKDRLAAAQWLVNESAAGLPPLITVLKGAGTVVADAHGAWAINTTGNPGMATGGMGDVLAGLIGGLLAQGHDPWEAACLGVFVHGLAADRLAMNQPYGYTATAVAQTLPLVLGALSKEFKEEIIC